MDGYLQLGYTHGRKKGPRRSLVAGHVTTHILHRGSIKQATSHALHVPSTVRLCGRSVCATTPGINRLIFLLVDFKADASVFSCNKLSSL